MIPQAYLDEFDEPIGWLNHAGIGPPSRSVLAALAQLNKTLARPEGQLVSVFYSVVDKARAAGARLFGTEPHRIGVVPSTGQALFHVAFGLRRGNVVVPAAEFPANVYPWLRAQEAGLIDEVRLVQLPDGRLEASVLAPHIDRNTAAVAISSVDFATGFRADLDEIRNVAPHSLLVVDAVQGAGAVATALGSADVIASGSQKWLRAGLGGAFLAVSDRALERLEPTLTGWLGVTEPFAPDPPPPHELVGDATRYQVSAVPLAGMVALTAGVDVLEIAGIATIEEAVLQKAKMLEQVALSAGAEVWTPWKEDRERAGIFCFRLTEEPCQATVVRLEARGIQVSDRAGWVRLAPHATTKDEAADLLREAL